MSYCMLRLVSVVSCIKRLQIIRIISDKDWNVAAMFHQVLLMFCLKVTTPLQKRRAKVNVELCGRAELVSNIR